MVIYWIQSGTRGASRAPALEFAGGGDHGPVDAGAGGVPCADQRHLVDWISAGCGAVAAAPGDNQPAVVVALEGHGREEIFPGVDLSRTVGWFTSLFPVMLDPGEQGWAEPGRALKRIKEQLRRIPDQGLGYGLLRYMNPKTGAVLAEQAGPQLGFNYLGRFDGTGGTGWSGLGEGEPAMPLTHVVDINALTMDRPEGPELSVNWTWAKAILPEAAVQELAEDWFAALHELVRCAEEPGAGGFDALGCAAGGVEPGANRAAGKETAD